MPERVKRRSISRGGYRPRSGRIYSMWLSAEQYDRLCSMKSDLGKGSISQLGRELIDAATVQHHKCIDTEEAR